MTYSVQLRGVRRLPEAAAIGLALALVGAGCASAPAAPSALETLTQSLQSLRSQQGRLATRLHEVELELAAARAMGTPADPSLPPPWVKTPRFLPVVRLTPDDDDASPSALPGPPLPVAPLRRPSSAAGRRAAPAGAAAGGLADYAGSADAELARQRLRDAGGAHGA